MPDVLVGAGMIVGERLVDAGRSTARIALPALRLLMHPPLVPKHRHPARMLDALVDRGRVERTVTRLSLEHSVAVLIPLMVARFLEVMPLTELIKQNVDLDALVAEVDLDAVAARIDVDAVAARIDVEAILDRVDLTAIIRDRVDIDAVVSDVAIEPVINRIDLVALTEQIIDAIDLPEIIRQSTQSVTSEAVRDVRMRSIETDQAVDRVLERLLRRRRSAPRPPAAGLGPT